MSEPNRSNRRPSLPRALWAAGTLTLTGAPLGGCTRPTSPPATEPAATATPPDTATAPPPRQCAAAPAWRYERIELPPEFAPELPRGVEELWFAPGMFKTDASDYFTYAFSLALDEGDVAETAILEPYYRGLMQAVAASREREVATPATVEVSGDGLTATVEMSDEFTDSSTIVVELRLSQTPRTGQGPCVRVLATANPNDATWQSLERAASCLACESPP